MVNFWVISKKGKDSFISMMNAGWVGGTNEAKELVKEEERGSDMVKLAIWWIDFLLHRQEFKKNWEHENIKNVCIFN